MSAGRVHLGVRVRDDLSEGVHGPTVEVVDVAGNVVGDLTWSIPEGGVRWKGGKPSILTLDLFCERSAVDSIDLVPGASRPLVES